MDYPKHIEILFDRYLRNECNAAEFQQLLDYFNDEGLSARLDERLTLALEEIDNPLENHPEVERILSELDSELMLTIRKKPITRVLRIWLPIAASLLIVLGIGLLFMTRHTQGPSAANKYASDVAPGKKSATLVLSDGREILLNNAHSGALANESGVEITKSGTGELIYEHQGDSSQKVKYNTLKTSIGETYAVTLPDGSRVWLNASSEIRYPSSFAGLKKRSVELKGEGYFEVSKDKRHPFTVKTSGQLVEVLGTHFDINSYPEEKSTLTTLLEGSVKVSGGGSSKSDDQAVTLRPGQQSRATGTVIAVAEVPVDDIVAWKNGYFMFNSETLENAMTKVTRWYSVNVVYEDPQVKKEVFFGTISKYENISSVLNMFEGTGVVEFSIKGNTVTVRKKG